MGVLASREQLAGDLLEAQQEDGVTKTGPVDDAARLLPVWPGWSRAGLEDQVEWSFGRLTEPRVTCFLEHLP